MPFSVGDKVVYPKLGAGQIVGEKHQELMEGYEHYYVIEIPSKGSILYVPMSRIEGMGVRSIMSEATLHQVLEILAGPPQELPTESRTRQEQVLEKLETGDPIEIAEALRDLTWRNHVASLTKKDNDLLNQGKDFLAAEIALATDRKLSEAHDLIDEALALLTKEEDEDIPE